MSRVPVEMSAAPMGIANSTNVTPSTTGGNGGDGGNGGGGDGGTDDQMWLGVLGGGIVLGTLFINLGIVFPEKAKEIVNMFSSLPKMRSTKKQNAPDNA